MPHEPVIGTGLSERMKLKNTSLTLLIFLLGSGAAWGQTVSDSSDDYAAYRYVPSFAGYELGIPLLESNSFKSRGLSGYHIRYNGIEYQEFKGNMYIEGQSAEQERHIYAQMLGGSFYLKKLKRGNRRYDISGVQMLPFLNFMAGRIRVDANSSVSGIFAAAPGISFQLPYFVIEAKLQAMYIPSPDKYAGLNSFMFTPSFSILLDGLWNAYDPKRGVSGGNPTKTTSFVESYDYNIGPLQALLFKYSYNTHDYAGITKMFGAYWIARRSLLGIDLGMDAGKLGFASSYKDLPTRDNPDPSLSSINKDDRRYRGSVNAARFTMRAGLDLIKALSGAIGGGGHSLNADPQDGTYLQNSKHYGTELSPGNRFIAGGIIGYTVLNKNHFQYDEPNAEQDVNKYFGDNPQIYRATTSDVRTSLDGLTYGYFATLEAGSLHITFSQIYYEHFDLGNLSELTLGYILPYKRLINKYRRLKRERVSQSARPTKNSN